MRLLTRKRWDYRYARREWMSAWMNEWMSRQRLTETDTTSTLVGLVHVCRLRLRLWPGRWQWCNSRYDVTQSEWAAQLIIPPTRYIRIRIYIQHFRVLSVCSPHDIVFVSSERRSTLSQPLLLERCVKKRAKTRSLLWVWKRIKKIVVSVSSWGLQALCLYKSPTYCDPDIHCASIQNGSDFGKWIGWNMDR